ncbi:major prion protein [Rhinatrema bivittatum]|uniref:major prion protein n=1 Tax=Rhinatrema bivittatum TaxID=194408 RepID=UPI00112B9D6F|nr:major prion protein [Rhinatrema bivittatum]XP_029459924.1 major prion protein [Rhinatrema bivittatum]
MGKTLLTWGIAVLLFVTCMDISQALKIKSGKSKSKSPSSNWGSWGNSNSGTNRHPSQSGGSWNNPGSNWNNWGQNNWGQNNPQGGRSSYNHKPGKPKPNIPLIAGAAVAGAAVGGLGGYALGHAIGRNQIFLDNDYERQYYNSHYNQFPSRVYRPSYSQQVQEDTFVNDCFQYSMTEYVSKPAQGQNTSEADAMETKVMERVIRQLCIAEYRSGAELLSCPPLLLCLLLAATLVIQ